MATEKSYILKETKTTNAQQASLPVREDSSSTLDTRQLFANEVEGTDQEVSSLPYTSFNYINSIIGSGIIGMPYALRLAGFWFGLLLMIIVSAVTDYSLVLMVKGGNLAQTSSYQGLVEAAFGRPGFYILSFIQFFYPFIAMISYNVIISDTTTKVILRLTGLQSNSFVANRQFVIVVATLLITLPLSLYRQMSKLAKISFASLVFIAFIMLALLVRLGSLGSKIPATDDAWDFAHTGVTQAIGIMTFAFMCHHNTFLIYGSLENPTQARWNKVTHASIFVALVVSAMFGIAGYATFTGHSQGDILENYCITDDLMNAARFFFAITIMLTFPIECFVTREVVQNVWYIYKKPESSLQHVILTVVIVISAMIFSMATDCLGIVLELNGVLAAVPLAYIMPSLSYLKLEEGSLFSLRKLPAILTAMFGIVIAVSGIVMSVISFTSYVTCTHGELLFYCSPSWNESIRETVNSNVSSVASSFAVKRPLIPLLSDAP